MSVEEEKNQQRMDFVQAINALDITITMKGELWGVLMVPLMMWADDMPILRPAVSELMRQLFAAGSIVYEGQAIWPEAIEDKEQ